MKEVILQASKIKFLLCGRICRMRKCEVGNVVPLRLIEEFLEASELSDDAPVKISGCAHVLATDSFGRSCDCSMFTTTTALATAKDPRWLQRMNSNSKYLCVITTWQIHYRKDTNHACISVQVI